MNKQHEIAEVVIEEKFTPKDIPFCTAQLLASRTAKAVQSTMMIPGMADNLYAIGAEWLAKRNAAKAAKEGGVTA